MSYLNYAKNSIRKGNSKLAIELVGKFIDENDFGEKVDFSDRLIAISSRLSHYQKNQDLGVTNYEEGITELNKINRTILELITGLGELGQFKKDLSLKKSSLTNIPRIALSDNLYYGFLITGVLAGFSFGITFFILYYNAITTKDNSLEEFLYIGSIGIYGSSFLSGAYDGLNRSEGNLVNWKIMAPQIILASLMLLGAGLLYLVKE